MRKILFVDFHNASPHIETSFELAKRHLDAGDNVKFYFLGHDLPYREFLFLSKFESRLFRSLMPERRAAALLRHPRFSFISGDTLPLKTFDGALPSTLDELKAVTHHGADVGMGVASSLISRQRDSRLDPAKFSGQIRAAIEGSIAVYDYCLELFETENPDTVYLFNGRLCHPRMALRAGEKLGIDVRIHERGADMSRYVVRPFIPHDRQRIQAEIKSYWQAAPTQDAAVLGRKWFEERRAGQPRDWLSFTDHQNPAQIPELPRNKRIITYFSSSDDEFAAIGDAYQWEGWDDQLHAVSSLITTVAHIPDCQLVIRIHPHVAQKSAVELARWRMVASSSDSVMVVEPSSPVDSYALIEASDIVITGGSTIGAEATYWGVPSILLGPSDYDELGLCYVVRSEDELSSALKNEIAPMPRETALPYGYYRETFGEPFRYFQPYSLFGGKFMGTDLHRLPPLVRGVNQLKSAVLKQLRRPASSGPKSEAA